MPKATYKCTLEVNPRQRARCRRGNALAIYHLTAKVLKRSEGKSAVAAAAYRSGEKLHDERLGREFDYSRKRHVEHREIMAPKGAPDWVHDRGQLWNAVERGEKRKDAQLCREVEFALPRELDAAQRIAAARSFIRSEFVDKGMVADFAIHCPKAADGAEHPHCHVLLTMRPVAGDGFGQKARHWNAVERLEGWREAWALCANDALRQAGDAARIDHRSLDAQGIAREAEPYLGLSRRLKDLGDALRARVGQWVAVRERNALRPRLFALDPADPGRFALEVGRLLDMTAGRFGLGRERQQEYGLER